MWHDGVASRRVVPCIQSQRAQFSIGGYVWHGAGERTWQFTVNLMLELVEYNVVFGNSIYKWVNRESLSNGGADVAPISCNCKWVKRVHRLSSEGIAPVKSLSCSIIFFVFFLKKKGKKIKNWETNTFFLRKRKLNLPHVPMKLINRCLN